MPQIKPLYTNDCSTVHKLFSFYRELFSSPQNLVIHVIWKGCLLNLKNSGLIIVKEMSPFQIILLLDQVLVTNCILLLFLGPQIFLVGKKNNSHLWTEKNPFYWYSLWYKNIIFIEYLYLVFEQIQQKFRKK